MEHRWVGASFAGGAGPAGGCCGGADVLVEVENVVGVVPGFEGCEPLVVLLAVRVADAILAFDVEVVDVHASAEAGHLIGEGPDVTAAGIVLARIGPACGGHELEWGTA